jgi:hypothetical protein
MTARTRLGVIAALALVPRAVLTQVGHTPASSPFRDLMFRQEITGFAGYFMGARGIAGVAPRGGPAVGARYEVRIGGPAQFTARVAHVWSERTVIDFTRPDTSVFRRRDEAWPLVIGDLGLTVNLSGQKSIHGIVPVLNAGVGVASDLGKGGDPGGGFRFGTPFAFSFGAGIRWVPGGPLQGRLDFADYLYQITYPDVFFTGAVPVLTSTRPRSEWKHNPMLSLGVSYLFFR